MTAPLERRLAAALLSVEPPPHVLERARMLATDSLAIAVGASRRSEVGRAAVASALSGSAGACTVIGSQQRTSPALAAFANSALAHALDFDDTHDLARLHTTTVVLPAALAAAELAGAPGDAVLRGVVLGAELMCRVGLAAEPTSTSPAATWFLTQLVGYLGAAAAAGIALGLDEERLASALGFAYAQAAGAKQAGVANGSDERTFYPGFASSGGVTAALLARGGLRGPVDAFDGPVGFWQAYLRSALSDERAADLFVDGARWEFDAIRLKPWPSCRLAHPYIEAALALGSSGEPIERITIAVNPSVRRLCEPADARRRPTTLADAGFSVPFMTAVAFAKGAVTLDDFTPDVVHDPDVLALVDLIDYDDRLPDGPGNPAGEVTVHRGGSSATVVGTAHPTLDDDGIRSKARAVLDAALPGADPAPLLGAVREWGSAPVAESTASLRAWWGTGEELSWN